MALYSFILYVLYDFHLNVLFRLLIQSSESDNRTISQTKMAARTEMERFDIRLMIGHLDVYIIYSGPASSAAKDSAGASFIIFWPGKILPSIVCSQNLAATWALAVALGVIAKNDLPSVHIHTNCSYAIRIFEGINKAFKYREVWRFILDDLKVAVTSGRHYRSVKKVHDSPETQMERELRQILHTTLLDPANKVITSVKACKEFLEELPPYSPSVLHALVSSPEDSEGVYVEEVTSYPQWLSKVFTPAKTSRSGPHTPGQLDPHTELQTMVKHATDPQVSDLHVQRLELRPSVALPHSPSMTAHGSPSYEPAHMDTPQRRIIPAPPPPPGFNICAVVPDISRAVDIPLPTDDKCIKK